MKLIARIAEGVILVSVAGCASAPRNTDLVPTTVEIVKYVSYECGTAPAVDPVDMLPIYWKVLPDATGAQRFTLTPEGYEALGKNVSSILAAVQQLKLQRDFYVGCVADSQAGDLTNATN